jgi:hypothetical protein
MVLFIAEETNLRESILTSFMPAALFNPGHYLPQKAVLIKKVNDRAN